MKVGVYLPVSFPRGVPPVAEVVGYAAEAETLGFDDLWVGDHLLWRAPMPDPLTTLAALATRTSASSEPATRRCVSLRRSSS